MRRDRDNYSDDCCGGNELGSDSYIHDPHETATNARSQQGSDDTRHFDTPLPPPRQRKRNDSDSCFLGAPSVYPSVDWELPDRHIRMAKKKKGKAAPAWTPPKEDPPEEDKTPEESGDGGAGGGGGGEAGSGDAGDSGDKDGDKKEEEAPPEDDDWGSFAPVAKKGKKKGKKETEPEPEKKEDGAFDAFAEIKLDDGGALDLNFGSTADNETDSGGGGTSFGAWGSSWATAGKKEESKPVASAWGAPAKTTSAWGTKTSFSFGGLDDEAEKTKELESEPKEEELVGFTSAKDKKKKKKGAAEVIPEPVPDPPKEEEPADDWGSSWGTTSTKKKKEDAKPIASGWGSAWGSTKKADPEPAMEEDNTWGSFGKKKTSKALVGVVPEEPSPPPPPAAPEVGDLDDDDGFSAWGTTKTKKKKKGTDDGPLKPDVVEEPKDDIWGTATSKQDKKAGKSAFDALEEVTDEPLIDLDGDKKKEEESSSGWGGIWGSKDKKKGLDVPPTAPTPPNMDLTEPEEDIWGDGGDTKEAEGPSPEQLRVDELEIDLAVEKGKPKKKSKTQQKKQDDAIKKIEKELNEAKEALEASLKSKGPSKEEEEEARRQKEADDEIAAMEAEIAEQEAAALREEEAAEKKRVEETEVAAKKKADEEAAAAAEVSDVPLREWYEVHWSNALEVLSLPLESEEKRCY